jgi:hypothetical protein
LQTEASTCDDVKKAIWDSEEANEKEKKKMADAIDWEAAIGSRCSHVF